jgi:hypothetical protein
MIAYAKTKPRWQSIHPENEHPAAMAVKHPPMKTKQPRRQSIRQEFG